MNWLNNAASLGCDCNRPTLDSIRAAGFEVDEVEHSTLKKAPTFVRPLIVGGRRLKLEVVHGVARTATSYLPTEVRRPGVSSAGIALNVASAVL